MIVSVVDVGQGQCTFVEIWNDTNTKIVETLLFDCGTDQESTVTSNNLQYIANQIQTKMDTPAISCIFFSHSDDDHISLTRDLLNKFTVKKPSVGSVWYGGEYDLYEKRGTNILNYLVTNGYCAKGDIKTVNADYTGYSKLIGNYTHYLWRSGDSSVTVYPIVGNVLADDDPSVDSTAPPPKKRTRYAEQKNRVSLICGLYYRGFSYVICGDATNKTMAAANTVFSLGTTVFNSNVMTTLPHHGSRATGFAVTSSKAASTKNKTIVNSFATIMNSETLTISAYQLHSHPSMELMNEFIPRATSPILRDPRLKGKNVHHLNGFQDLNLTVPSGLILFKTYYIFETQSNTYSTQYSQLFGALFSYNLGNTYATKSEGVIPTTPPTSINPFACWIYQINTSGTTVQSYIDGVPYLGGAIFTSAPTTTLARLQSDEQMTTYSSLPNKMILENQTTESVQVRTKQRAYQFIPQSRFMRAKSFSI